MVIPDTQAYLDGHTTITLTYSVFRDSGAGNPLVARSKESTQHLEDITGPPIIAGLSLLRSPAQCSAIQRTDSKIEF